MQQLMKLKKKTNSRVKIASVFCRFAVAIAIDADVDADVALLKFHILINC